MFNDTATPFEATISSFPDATFAQADTDHVDIADFLKRPVKVAEIGWKEAGLSLDNFITTITINEGIYISPWQAFYSDPNVQAKLKNFHLVRSNLVVRFQINGTPFHYGRVLVSYNPFPNYGLDLLDINDTSQVSMVGASQRPHLYLNPTTSQGGIMTLPFFHPENAMRVSVLDDFKEMGEIRIQPFFNLAQAGFTGSTEVTINVWVHAENVSLSVPTTLSAFVPEGVDEYDEPDGVVSGPASNVARVAMMLTEAPVIGPFAMATSIGAGAVASIARLFGYSRPTLIDPQCNIVSKPVGRMALTDAPDTSEKLALTSKTEVTVDSRTVGLDGTDEMTIKAIAGRESFFFRTLWREQDDPDTPLGAWAVFPCASPSTDMTQVTLGNNGRRVHPTALNFASRPFRYWSGSITYRIQVIASAYHRGRLRIVYDPFNENVTYTAETLDTYNSTFQKVIDLDGERDIEFTVPWCQREPYKSTGLYAADASSLVKPEIWGVTPDSAGMLTRRPDAAFATKMAGWKAGFFNGFISIYSLNRLVSPDEASPVYIIASVKAGPDFELKAPHSVGVDGIYYQPPLAPQGMALTTIEEEPLLLMDVSNSDGSEQFRPEGDEAVEGGEQEHDGAPEMMETEQMVMHDPIVWDLPDKAKVFFGETVTSFRPLVKRYTKVGIHALESDTYADESWSMPMSKWTMSVFPPYAGFFSSASAEVGAALVTNRHNANADNYFQTSFLTYLAPGYLGWRGSIRRKFQYISPSPNGQHTLTASRVFQVLAEENQNLSSILPSGGGNTRANRERQGILYYPGGWSGACYTTTPAQGSLEVELPYYRRNRFSLARVTSTHRGILRDTSSTDAIMVYAYGSRDNNNGGTVQTGYMVDFVAAGDDFSFFFFLNAPCYWQSTYWPPDVQPTV